MSCMNMYINDEPYRVEDPMEMLYVIKEKMGEDAFEYCRPYLLEPELSNQCLGECDKTYELEEHHERIMKDFEEDLTALLDKKKLVEIKSSIKQLIEKAHYEY